MSTAAPRTPPGPADESSLVQRLRSEVERTIQRGLKGLDHLGSPAPAVGITPKTLLHRRGTLNLYHYHPGSAEVYRVPVLLVMATTNKSYLFDLAPGQSLIEFLIGRGYDVYVMDWNAPTDQERGLRLEDYTLDFIPDCIRRVQAHCGVDEVTLVGYCMGGVLSVIYAALHPGGPLANLVCFTTPVDWSQMTLFRAMSDPAHFDVDRLVDTMGNIPSRFVVGVFEAQRPVSEVTARIRLWDNLWNDAYVAGFRRMKRWGAETLPLAGEYFRQTVKELMWKNSLHEGTLKVGGKRVALENITVPLLHVVAQYDHLVPPACAKPLVERAGSRDKQELMLQGGHVSLVAGASAVKRMWPALDQWLERRST